MGLTTVQRYCAACDLNMGKKLLFDLQTFINSMASSNHINPVLLHDWQNQHYAHYSGTMLQVTVSNILR